MFDKEIVEVSQIISQSWVDKSSNFIIGIDGLSRSGKSVFSQLLYQSLTEFKVNIVVIHLDDFITPKPTRYNTSRPDWEEYYFLQWDINYLKNSLFSKLKSNSSLNLLNYISGLDIQKNIQILIPKPSVVIVEGVFIQRPEWKEFLDYTIYIKSSREVRFQRENIKTQTNLEKFETRYWKAEEYYLETIQPEINSDFRLLN